MKKQSPLASLITSLAVVIVTIAGAGIAVVVIVAAINADWGARLSETNVVSRSPRPDAETEHIGVQLVLHRLLLDANSVEASLIVDVRGIETSSDVRRGDAVIVTVHDSSTDKPGELALGKAVLDATSFDVSPTAAAIESERFVLAAQPNVGMYPFDDVRMRPMLYVRRGGSGHSHVSLTVHKAFPGWRLHTKNESGIPVIRFTRPGPEKVFVMAAAVVFLFVSLIVTIQLFGTNEPVSGFPEVLAVAGFLLAAAGFRELLGVSRLPVTSLLEITILGIPLVLVSFGVAVSLYRSRRARRA